MKKIAFVAAMTLVPFAASAQFVPTLDSKPRICPDQPPRPVWVENIDIRDAHKGNLVQQMYRAQSMRAVAESGDCSCEIRYPSWEAAEAYYFEHYAGLERHEILDRTSEYRRIANEYRREAKPTCQQQGNW